MCIGESFAWSEAIVILAALAQRWRLALDPVHPIETQPLITLRTRHGVRATPHARVPNIRPSTLAVAAHSASR